MNFTSTTTLRVLPRSSPLVLPSQTCFIVLADLGFWNTHVVRGCGTCQKIEALARPRKGWAYSEENERYFWLVMWTAENCTVLLANVLGRMDVAVCHDKKHVHPKAPASRSELLFTWPHPPSPSLRGRAPFLDHTTFALEWEIIHSSRQRILVWELLILRLWIGASGWLSSHWSRS